MRIGIESLLSDGTTTTHPRYVRYLWKTMGLDGLANGNPLVELTTVNLADMYNVSLRFLERVVLNIAMYVRVGRVARISDVAHLAAALCMMVRRHQMCDTSQTGALTAEEAVGFLRIDAWTCDTSSRATIEAWWNAVTHGDSGSTAGLDAKVVGIQTRFPASVAAQGPEVAHISLEGVLKEICKDIDRFWQ